MSVLDESGNMRRIPKRSQHTEGGIAFVRHGETESKKSTVL